MEIQVPFDIENLTATHTCACCGRQLFSAMDIEIEQVTAEMGIKSINKPYYSSNI
ncbi:MAG: hypothetical protein ACXVB0_04325 [Mucilaginibacter sp.]